MQAQTQEFEVLELQSFLNNSNNNPVVTPAKTYDSHEHQIAIQIIIKIIQRNYSRHFIKGLTFAFIQSLRKPQFITNYVVKENQNINWPFRDLYEKKYKDQQQKQLFQFVNLCAQLIQSRFKGYITRKRHKLAISMARKSKDVLTSFVRNWKINRIFNCQKIWQIRRKIRQIQKQIDEQQEKFTNRDAKKLKGLYKYLQIHTKMFTQTFNLLMETGLWTLQKNMKAKPKIHRPAKQTTIEAPSKNTTRVREYRAEGRQVRRNPKQQENEVNINIQEIKKENVDHNISRQLTTSNSNNRSDDFGIEDRPIKATGQYQFNENQIEDNISLIRKRKQQEKNQDGQVKRSDQNEPMKVRERNKKAQQLQKRTKYDPRKAIQEEKKKKQQQQKKKLQQKSAQTNISITNTPEQSLQAQAKPSKAKATKNKPDTSQQNKQKIQETKTVVKNVKQKKVQTKIKNANKDLDSSNTKQAKVKKVASKVDCWANKKEAQPEWVKEYKSRILENRDDSQEKVTDGLRKSIEKQIGRKIQERNTKVEERGMKVEQKTRNYIRVQRLEQQNASYYQLQRKRLKSETEQKQRQAALQNWKNRQKQIQTLKQKQDEFMGHRKNSSHNIHNIQVQVQEQVRAMIYNKNNMKKKEVHRSIEELEETYNKHYGDRYQNLIPKLSLLAVARDQEKYGRIAVVAEETEQFNQWFYGLYNSTHYWKMISQQDRIFKSFLAS